MIPGEIHDPKVLDLIVAECRYLGERAHHRNCKIAYSQMARAAKSLAATIRTGRSDRVICPLCNRDMALNKEGRFRYHSGCKAVGMTPEAAAEKGSST